MCPLDFLVKPRLRGRGPSNLVTVVKGRVHVEVTRWVIISISALVEREVPISTLATT